MEASTISCSATSCGASAASMRTVHFVVYAFHQQQVFTWRRQPAPASPIYVELVNAAFLREGGSPDEFRAGIANLKADGLIEMHVSGAYFCFTDKGAQRFA